MKKSRYVVLAALFAGTLSLTACGSSSDSQMNTGTSQSSGAVQTTGETREGVIDGVMDDLEDDAENVKDKVENGMDNAEDSMDNNAGTSREEETRS
ncbi:MAG TPA: hypothetical protein H9704_00195 [Candidatus Enterocloster excrementipullorum]|uniref:Lipoprotein n=1 Tax=Candidatus Enterocloster excrementipullorum TaxID=2838559 RepID=A0A9D2SFS7_9FIRM|nr:hypothetical protein [Candidatus Enterocloster excrementipullorum]